MRWSHLQTNLEHPRKVLQDVDDKGNIRGDNNPVQLQWGFLRAGEHGLNATDAAAQRKTIPPQTRASQRDLSPRATDKGDPNPLEVWLRKSGLQSSPWAFAIPKDHGQDLGRKSRGSIEDGAALKS
jgi:hypothetical protein